MAASQARLLSLTARIHDVEHQAQSIQNAKVQLATQSDQVYQDYMAAMNENVLAFDIINGANGQKSTIAANFNNLCSINRAHPAVAGTTYALRNSQGLLIVEDNVYEAYSEGRYKNGYEFAMYMLLGDGNVNLFYDADSDGIVDDVIGALENAELEVLEDYLENNSGDSILRTLCTQIEDLVEGITTIPGNATIYDYGETADADPAFNEEKKENYKKLIEQLKNELYKNHANEIYQMLLTNASYGDLGEGEVPDINQEQFDYYVSIFNQIQACGGCISIDEYNGPHGNAANDADWLHNMVQSGLISVELVNVDPRTGKTTLSRTSPSSDSTLSFREKTSIDNRALAKAEAEYEHKLKQINSIDKKYDLDLSKLETERNALTTELDTVKTVIKDNVTRSFKIFS
jgi:hypothetical protein